MFAFNTVEELFMKQSALLLPRPASYCPGLQDQESHGPETADHCSTTNFSPNAPRSCCAVIAPLMWSVNDHFGQTKFRCVVQTNDSEIATQSKNQRILTEKSRQGIKEKHEKETATAKVPDKLGNCLGLVVSVEPMKKFTFGGWEGIMLTSNTT